jgi:hypothetical protein
MSRWRQRVCLQDGLKLDLNRLAHRGFNRRGAKSGPLESVELPLTGTRKLHSGVITADMSGTDEGWLRIQLGNLDQRMTLVAHQRHFGGRQWYFMCPVLNRAASVVWKPPGQVSFAAGTHGGGGRSHIDRSSWRFTTGHGGT